jgi:hypothetical protein
MRSWCRGLAVGSTPEILRADGDLIDISASTMLKQNV